MSWISLACRALPWLIAAGAIFFGVIERSNYAGEKAARATDLANAEKAALEAKEADAATTRALEDAHAAEIAKLKDEANARDVSIAEAPNGDACLGSAPMRALFDGLRNRAAAPGAGPARRAGGTR